MDIKNFTSAIAQIAEEKGILADKVIETIEMAIAAAYKKDYGRRGQMIKAKLDPESGDVKFWQIKQVVNEEMLYTEAELEELKEKKGEEVFFPEEADEKGKIRFNAEKHIMLQEAKAIDKKAEVGDNLELPLIPHKDYGRIAAQTAKQVILQRIREAERESIFGEFKSKEGEIISGIVQRIEGQNVFMDIGKTLGVLPREEQVPGEFYKSGQRFKVYLLKVEETSKGPAVFLSRAYPKIVSKLFELEVPEIASGQVQIKSIAREAGSRSKIAVATDVAGLDPIGSAVGQRGTRVMAVINELGGEKIDIIEYSPEPKKYIANALSPAKVLEIKILEKNKALAVVPEDQLSLAIGKEGQNVRLAAKLTGWKIDVRGAAGAIETETEAEIQPETEVEPKPEPETESEAEKSEIKEEPESVK